MFVAPEDRAEAERVVGEVVAGGDPGEQQSRWLTKDGREVTVAWTCRPMPKVTGEDPSLLVSGSDVTERVRHEERIQRERDYFGALFDATPSFICVVDHDGSMTSHSLNRSMMQLTGYEDEDVAGKPLVDTFSAPEDATLVAATIAAAAAGEDPGEQETYWTTRTAARSSSRGRARRFRTRGGATTGDQRRRRHREKAQEEEQAALRRVAVAVAAESRPEDIFQTVTEEVGRLLGADFASMVRFLPDANEGLIVGYWQQGEPIQDDTPLGRMITFSGDGPSEVARTTGRLTRYEQNRTLRPDWRERPVRTGRARA